jgi:hypothetical protein
MKTLKLWNGRPYGVLPASQWNDAHVCIAAYSVADAQRVCIEAGMSAPSASEIKEYFSPCWGNDMDGVVRERGLWVTRRNVAPERIVKSAIEGMK